MVKLFWRASLAKNFYAFERLRECHTNFFPDLGIVGSRRCLALCPGTLHLAGVAVEGVQFDAERIGDVQKGIWLLGAPEIDFPHLVGLQAFLLMLWIRQGITGVGENRIQGHTATDRVVTVTDVATVGVNRDHGLRPMETNLPDQLLTEFGAVLQTLIWEV